jgi:hypothetical protein
MRTLHLPPILLVAAALAAGGVYAALEATSPAPTALAAYAPPGALLAIESPDFTTLLHSWNNSAEQRRWLAGDDYADFSRSRLFGRLSDAQSEFATAAGLAPDSNFVQEVAGSQSLCAWYDIGNLEFLYITRLAADQAARMPLLALRDKFEQRQAGGVTFYVRTSEDAANASPAAAAPGSDGTGDNARPRTVAFAVSGDLLLLATREDLIAGALAQRSHPGGRSLATDPWYAASVAAANEKPGDLRLTLDLAKITRSPYFRTYWVQQNITATRRYSAGLSDLYREPGVFREERFLLPSSGSQTSVDTDLDSVLHFLPSGVVYRAVAHPSADDTLAELEDKLLVRGAANMPNPHEAPSADLSVPITGDPSDLDDRIDSTKAPTDARATALTTLQSLLNTNAPIAMLSISSASAAVSRELSDQSGILGTIHTGVALATATSCDAAVWRQALTAALSPRLTVGDAGLHWSEQRDAKVSWSQLDGSFPLALAAKGNTCLLASDSSTLLAMLSTGDAPAAQQTVASSVAGFNHATQRAPLLKLAALLDRSGGRSSGASNGNGKPTFFSGNIASLSSTFEDLDSETFTEFQASPTVTRQSVVYPWHQR